MFDPKSFYQSYLKDYHKFKIISIKKILNDLPKYEKEFFGKELNEEGRKAYEKSLKADLRQTYFHSIETFFELLFALDPTNKTTLDDEEVLFNISNSNPTTTYNRIKSIALDENALDFLDKEIQVLNFKVTSGHYLFYFGIFDRNKFQEELLEAIVESLDAIKYGIKIIANDFIKREEYNSYKHGLKIIPALSKIMFASAKTFELKVNWDLKDSMSFYYKTKNPNELKVITKLFDSDRDYCMTYFCSNLINHLVYYRKVSFFKDKTQDNQIPITMFGKEEIDNCNKINVKVQDLVWTVTK